MNVPYLIRTLKTDKLSELVANIDLPAIDMNLAIWDAISSGAIEVDESADTVCVTEGPGIKYKDAELADKIVRVVEHYAKQETNVTRGRLNSYVKDPVSGLGYPWHNYIMTVQCLVDEGILVEEVIEVPEEVKTTFSKKGKRKDQVVRPGHKFAFLGLPENGDKNAEWNAKTVKKWLADVSAHSVE